MRLFRSCLLALTGLVSIPLLVQGLSAPTKPHPQAGTEDPAAAATCGKCHTEIYREWKDRTHNHAWTDPIYQAAIKKKKRPKTCHGCHIPGDSLARPGRKPKTRKHNLDEGVTCVSCHRLGEEIWGPFGAKTEAHPSKKSELFTKLGSIKLCTSCHGTKIAGVQPVAKQFARSGLADKGKSCVGCHMPEVERHLSVDPASGKPVRSKRPGRRHEVLGPRDVEFCAKAFKLAARTDGPEMVVELRNGAGHGIPGVRLRKFVIRAAQLDAAGNVLREDRLELTTKKLLKALASRELRVPKAAGARSVRLEVDHLFQDRKIATVLSKTLPL